MSMTFYMLIAYLTSELVCIYFTKQTLIGKMAKELLHTILHSFTEVTSKKGEQKFCGAIVMLALLTMLILVCAGFYGAFTHQSHEQIILIVGILLLFIPFIMGLYNMNRKYIVRR